MQLGIFAKTFPGSDPLSVLSASEDAGYAGVAYNMVCSGLPSMPEDIEASVIEKIAAASEKTGQRLLSLSATYNMAHPDRDVRERGLKRLDVLAACAKPMGTDLLTLCTGTRDPEDQWRNHPDNTGTGAWRDMMMSFEGAVAIAEKHDVYLGVEPEMANVVSSTRAASRLIDDLQSDRIRIVLDPANQFETATPEQQRRLVDDAIDVLGDRLSMAHAKDRHQDGSFAAAGRGVVDFDHFVGALRKIGFDGPFVTHGLSADEASEVAAFLKPRIDEAVS